MTKEDILIKAFNDRDIREHNREMDTEVHYAIMDAMEEYAQIYGASSNNVYKLLAKKLNMQETEEPNVWIRKDYSVTGNKYRLTLHGFELINKYQLWKQLIS